MRRAGMVLGLLALWILLLARGNAVAETYYMLFFSTPRAGQEAEYNRWYDHQHAPDVVAVPGFVAAQRYKLSDPQLMGGTPALPLPQYLVIYRIETDNLSAVLAEMNRRVRSGETVISPTLASGMTYMYRALGPKIAGAGGQPPNAHPGPVQTYLHIVFNVALAGKEAPFNQWYDQHHAPEMASIPGFVSAQRLILQQMPGPAPGPAGVPATKYAALFEFRTSDVDAEFQAFRHRSKAMVIEPVFDMKKTRGYTYRAIGPMLDGDTVRRERAQH